MASKKPSNVKKAPASGGGSGGGTTALAKMGGGASEQEAALTKKERGSGFLPFLNLIQASSDAIKKNTPPGVRAGEYVLAQEENLGSEVRAWVGVSRPHAIWMGDETIESHVVDDESWTDVVAAKARKEQNCRLGIQFLIWLPAQVNDGLSASTFGIFGFYNTARDQGASMIEAREKKCLAVMKSEFIETKKFSWHGPLVTYEKAEVAIDTPTEEQLEAALQAFNAYLDAKPAAKNPTSRPR